MEFGGAPSYKGGEGGKVSSVPPKQLQTVHKQTPQKLHVLFTRM